MSIQENSEMKWSLREWINAYDLSCPELKYNIEHAMWVGLESDPCLEGRCNRRTCPNYLEGFSKPERLIIVVNPSSET